MNDDHTRWFTIAREGRWFWIEQGKGTSGSAVLPVTLDGVVLLRQRRASQGWADTIEIPRGMRDPGEDDATCALRELAEETGYRVPPDCLHPLGYLRPDSGLLATRIALFWADCRTAPPPGPPDEEAEEVFVLTFDEFDRWLTDGRIEDSFTLAAVLRLRLAGTDLRNPENP